MKNKEKPKYSMWQSICFMLRYAWKYGIPAGAAVQSVTENGPAAQAGLQRGDIITAVDGKAMTSTELVSFVGQASVGQQIVFSIYRQGDTLEITVDVGEQIQSALEQ